MESGARGCEIIVSGKLRGQRAKAMKFIDGLMIHSGEPTNQYVQRAIKHVELRQGVLGIKIKIMLKYDPTGKQIFCLVISKLSAFLGLVCVSRTLFKNFVEKLVPYPLRFILNQS